MLAPFIIIGAIGLGLLLISLLLGDVFDSLDVGDGLFSGTSLGVALVVFGASGVLVISAGLEPIWAYVLAVALAVGALVLTGLLIRKLHESSDGVAPDVVGQTGIARTDVSAHGGEVNLDGAHELESRLAFSDLPVPAGARIRVVSHVGTRVKVEQIVTDLYT